MHPTWPTDPRTGISDILPAYPRLPVRSLVCSLVRLRARSVHLSACSLVSLFAVLHVRQPGHPPIRPAVRPSDRPSFTRCLSFVAGCLLFAHSFASLSYRMCRRSVAAR
ncbi:hypothetical protein HOY82DRAFT_566589 [Tuber indicum]|nr:hypothetical protein HOY82DRAFT_566589 [Tuber indicum]